MLYLSIGFVTLSILVSIYRLIKGPSTPERTQALDALGINMIAGMGVFSVILRSTAFFEVILLLGILSFIGTIALAKYMERGVVIERRSSD